ncbi:MAG: hypothetical protein LBI56_01855 [Puniceicoccales bacterium]|jgi:tyrosine-specific transport protein|nr:hypothetical protein [Puniceicoccales bacterium]
MNGKLLSAILFIAGTAIGASVLGLPIDMRLAGLLPASLMCILMGVAMGGAQLMMAHIFLEAKASDLPSMFTEKLGVLGGKLFTLTYATLIFCLLVAFWTGTTRTFEVFSFGNAAIVLVFIGIACCLGFGFSFAAPLNTFLTTCMGFVFLCLIGKTIASRSVSPFDMVNFKEAALALPIVMCSYGFFPVIPMVCRLFNGDKKMVSRAIIWGAAMPIIFNLTILVVSFSVLTQQELAEGAANGWPVFVALKNKLNVDSLALLGNLFSVFSILSSLLGVTTSMKGAFADIGKSWPIFARVAEFVAVLIVPFFVAMLCPGIFIKILGFAGGILVNILVGLLPIIIFIKNRSTNWKHALLFVVFFCTFCVELVNLFCRG